MSEMYGKIVIQAGGTVADPVEVTITNLETGVKVVDAESVATDIYSKIVPGLQVYDVAVNSDHKVVTVGFGDVSIPFIGSGLTLKRIVYASGVPGAGNLYLLDENGTSLASGADNIVTAFTQSSANVSAGYTVIGVRYASSRYEIINEKTTENKQYTSSTVQYSLNYCLCVFE